MEDVLTALYVVNKHAKQFADEARRSYTQRNHSTAEINSERKEALYALKHHVLTQLQPQADRIAKHTIAGSDYYYLQFEDGWGFQIPTEELSVSDVYETETLSNFTKDGRITGVSMSLKQALITLNDELNANANDFLPSPSNKWVYLY